MSNVYLINIGANTAHGGRARSPLFENGEFRYVSFPCPGNFPHGARLYTDNITPFIHHERCERFTHADPDWDNLTYGDFCANGRASNLRNAKVNDLFLFWGLLWRNTGSNWNDFTDKKSDRRWCFIGALRIQEIFEPHTRLEEIASPARERARQNIHFRGDALEANNYVFLGSPKHSGLFEKAVDMEEGDLVGKTILQKDGKTLPKIGWQSNLRSCRVVWDLANPDDRESAQIVRDAVKALNGFDLLLGL